MVLRQICRVLSPCADGARRMIAANAPRPLSKHFRHRAHRVGRRHFFVVCRPIFPDERPIFFVNLSMNARFGVKILPRLCRHHNRSRFRRQFRLTPQSLPAPRRIHSPCFSAMYVLRRALLVTPRAFRVTSQNLLNMQKAARFMQRAAFSFMRFFTPFQASDCRSSPPSHRRGRTVPCSPSL